MKQYLNMLQHILDHGKRHVNRTSQDTIRIWGYEFRHDLADGFPLLTTKKMARKAAFVELLGFLRGETDVRWYQERGCKIWNSDHERWHGKDLEKDRAELHRINNMRYPDVIEQQLTMTQCDLDASVSHRDMNPHSLGHIYGAQWRNLAGHDQLAGILQQLRDRSNSRRLIMSAWNPAEHHMMCLPPCHISYHFMIDGDRLNIKCDQRSCDTPLGVPFNICNTALLCHVMAHCSGLIPGEMIWYGNDVHIYENQLEGVHEQLSREPKKLPKLLIETPRDWEKDSIDPWEIEYSHINLLDYEPHPPIKYELTVS